ncbi:interleukin-1 receptor-associated kinase 1-binding protein 1 homolog [Brienomyrus brachyistius]|uniref:interleukin-1 receptor-associated kinase 1-binding protein 1 homolog n=1 Tax=Brienomyrus brachyistius TaxID=42636 RepID=UPI0020B208E7|nr:interleukin-1 receptor-associated kinase 1-binding protein 1 homolog [Brienomyrus brachyistius]
MAGSPSCVYAALVPARRDNLTNENDTGLGLSVKRAGPICRSPGGEIQVTGSAEVTSPPDRAVLCISVSNAKGSVSDVTESVTRRLDYILQTLRQHDVKEEHTTVTKSIRREVNTYYMEAEVSAIFTDFEKMQVVSNTLVEKLDKTVSVYAPQFSHSAEHLAQLRRKACVAAVANAQQKAREACSLLGQGLGQPLLIREEESREWSGDADEATPLPRASLQQWIRQATVSVAAQVFVAFQIRPKERARKRH